MKILDLPLKAKWYDMIESGVKTEEYREIKPYWEKRLLNYKAIKANARGIAFKKYFLGLKFDACVEFPRGYTHVRFRYGYTKRTMLREIESIRFGYGNPEWGAPKDKQVFIIKLKPMNAKEKLAYSILSKYAKKKGLVKYVYPDGFYVFGNPDSQELADKKHKEWLKSKKGGEHESK